MNILIVSGIFPPDIGGPANFVPRIANWLTDKGYKVKIICWSNDPQLQIDENYPFDIYRIDRGSNRIKRFIISLFYLYKLARFSDLIFVCGLNFHASIIARLLNKPHIHRVVGDWAWEYARNKGFFSDNLINFQSKNNKHKYYFILLLLKKFRNISLAKASKIITVSHYFKKIIDNWQIKPQDIEVIYNSYQPNLPIYDIDFQLDQYEGTTLITVSRLISLKAIDQIIAILPKLNNCRLLIVGDGDQADNLKKQVDYLQLKNRVLFLGKVQHNAIYHLLKKSDIFLLNSIHEGFPHVILEAMINKLAVISTKVGGVSEIIENKKNGLLIQPNQPDQLLDAIKLLLTDHQLKNTLVKNAYDQVQIKFNQQKCFLNYEKIFIKYL